MKIDKIWQNKFFLEKAIDDTGMSKKKGTMGREIIFKK